MIEKTLTKFDVVFAYILKEYRKGINLPIFQDTVNWNKANADTLELANRGLLNEFCDRILKGTL